MSQTSRDSGQAAALLVISLAIALMTVLVVVVLPLGAATDEKTQSQTAADAAALAGARAAGALWAGGGVGPDLPEDQPAPGLPVESHDASVPVMGGVRGTALDGYEAARDFAERNGASIVEYTATPGVGRVMVVVENTSSVLDGVGRARSRAVAQVGTGPDPELRLVE